MDVTRKLIWIGVLLLATLATGFWRGNFGSDGLSGILHKLLGLAWVVYSTIVLYHTARPIESRVIFYTAIAVLTVSMVGLVWSGSMLTLPNINSAGWLLAHRIESAFAVVASVIVARLFLLHKL
jgi:hypothetical protein